MKLHRKQIVDTFRGWKHYLEMITSLHLPLHQCGVGQAARRSGCDRGWGRSSHSHINVDIFSLLSIIIAILFVFDWQIIALCAETYFHFIFLFLPSICCMRSIVWNKCTAPVVSPPSTILHHHSWHFGIKSNVRSVLSLSHSKSNQCNGGHWREAIPQVSEEKKLFPLRNRTLPRFKNSRKRLWVFGNFCLCSQCVHFSNVYPSHHFL